MVRAATCLLHEQEIGIDEALELRDQARRSRDSNPPFRCVECGEPVRPHAESDYGGAHIEHLSRNPDCRLSDAGP